MTGCACVCMCVCCTQTDREVKVERKEFLKTIIVVRQRDHHHQQYHLSITEIIKQINRFILIG